MGINLYSGELMCLAQGYNATASRASRATTLLVRSRVGLEMHKH